MLQGVCALFGDDRDKKKKKPVHYCVVGTVL